MAWSPVIRSPEDIVWRANLITRSGPISPEIIVPTYSVNLAGLEVTGTPGPLDLAHGHSTSVAVLTVTAWPPVPESRHHSGAQLTVQPKWETGSRKPRIVNVTPVRQNLVSLTMASPLEKFKS